MICGQQCRGNPPDLGTGIYQGWQQTSGCLPSPIPSISPYKPRQQFVMPIPPGISFLATTISQASLLPLTLGILDHYVLRPYEIHDLPIWATAVTCLLSPLTAFSVRLLSGDLIVYVKAKRAGAVLPPHNPTWVPGAIHRVLARIGAEDTVYPGNMSADRHRSSTDHLSKAISLRI